MNEAEKLQSLSTINYYFTNHAKRFRHEKTVRMQGLPDIAINKL